MWMTEPSNASEVRSRMRYALVHIRPFNSLALPCLVAVRDLTRCSRTITSYILLSLLYGCAFIRYAKKVCYRFKNLRLPQLFISKFHFYTNISCIWHLSVLNVMPLAQTLHWIYVRTGWECGVYTCVEIMTQFVTYFALWQFSPRGYSRTPRWLGSPRYCLTCPAHPHTSYC